MPGSGAFRAGRGGEVTLDIALLVWERSQGKWVGGVRVRFGGIENLEEVERFFATELEDKSELADLRYAETPKSKLGKLHVELICEHVDARLVVRCSSLQVTGPEVGNLPRG